nr:MAG TPA: hypothetical protein [Caudoviricetes sp.]
MRTKTIFQNRVGVIKVSKNKFFPRLSLYTHVLRGSLRKNLENTHFSHLKSETFPRKKSFLKTGWGYPGGGRGLSRTYM